MEMGMELQLSLSLPSLKGFGGDEDVKKKNKSREEMSSMNNKRCFSQAFHLLESSSHKLAWNAHPNDDQDPTPPNKNTCPTSPNKIGAQEKEVVGWPPIKSWRKKIFSGHQGERIMVTDDQTAERERCGSKSMLVKVKMEGVAIGRKVDLRLYQSYGTLRNALIRMFDKYQKGDKSGVVRYTLAYQDREGDWLLVGDVPWEAFIESVQRMKILRSAG